MWVRSLGEVSWVLCSSAPQIAGKVLGKPVILSRVGKSFGNSCSCWNSLLCRCRAHGGCIFKASPSLLFYFIFLTFTFTFYIWIIVLNQICLFHMFSFHLWLVFSLSWHCFHRAKWVHWVKFSLSIISSMDHIFIWKIYGK